MDFKEAIKLPYHLVPFSECYVWSSNNRIAFTCLTDNRELLQRIIDKINGNSNEQFNAECKGQIIYIDGCKILLIRGWGYLTGIGGLNLSYEEATKIQDNFCEWCIERLNK